MKRRNHSVPGDTFLRGWQAVATFSVVVLALVPLIYSLARMGLKQNTSVAGRTSHRNDESAVDQQLMPAFLPAIQGYPGPTILPPPTEVPPGDEYPIPSGITHEVVTIGTAPDSDLLSQLKDELDTDNASHLAARLVDPFHLQIAEGCANGGLSQAKLESGLSSLFSGGSVPTIQGYFRQSDALGRKSVRVYVTGWQGTVPIPGFTPEPEPASPLCNNWPIAPAEWGLYYTPDSSTWWWEDWRSGRYESLVRSRAGMGTYFVIRP